MKKPAVAIAVLLFFVLPGPARGALPFYPVIVPLLSPYSCTAAGFSLTKQQDTYRLTGPAYVPTPGYTSALSPIVFNTPPDAVATLTLFAPQNPVNPRLFAVPPLWVDYSFVSAIPVHQLTIYINKPFTGNDTPVICLQTGVVQ